MDPVSILLSSIQQIALLVILLGMITAFLAKLAFFINLIIGFIITFLITYGVFTLTNNIMTSLVVFAVGFVVSFVIAVIGQILTLLEAFILIMLGIASLIVGGSPADILSTGTLIISGISSFFLTSVSAYLGSAILTSVFDKGKRLPGFLQSIKSRSVNGFQSSKSSSVSKTTEQTLGNYHKRNNSEKSTSDKITELLIEKRENECALKNLDKSLEENKIDQRVYGELSKEFQYKLTQNNIELLDELETISKELKSLKTSLTYFEVEKKSKKETLEEIRARLEIKQMSRHEYMVTRNAKNNEIRELDFEIKERKERILELEKILQRAEYDPTKPQKL